MSEYKPERPIGIAPALADGLKKTQSLLSELHTSSLAEPGRGNAIYELEQKQIQFGKALTAALGLSLQANVMRDHMGQGPYGPMQAETFSMAIPGQTFNVQAQFGNEGGEPVEVKAATVQAADGKSWTIKAKPAGEVKSEPSRRMGPQAPVMLSAPPHGRGREAGCGKFQFIVTAPADASYTRPYFSRENEEQPYYTIDDPRYRNLPLAPYPLAASFQVSYQGATFPIAKGSCANVPAHLRTGPAAESDYWWDRRFPCPFRRPREPYRWEQKAFSFSATVHSNVKGPASGALKLSLPAGWKSAPESAPFSMSRDGEDQTIAFKVSPGAVEAKDFKITAVAEYQGKQFTEGYRMVGYSGLRPYPFYRPAIYHAVGVDVKTAPGLKIAYLPGTGDEVPQALENLGQNVRILAASDITQGSLSGFDAIILGTRAYAVRPELKSANNRLLEYVKDGGVLIVQYNLQGFDREYGPFPFSLGDNPQKRWLKRIPKWFC